jgi:glycosyltransferase involved in cell wall biosynthesis
MAAGLPVVSPAVGDVAAMVGGANARFIGAPGEQDALARALAKLASDPAARRTIGAANQALARQQYDEGKMIERYRSLYWGLMGRRGT